MAVQYNNHKLKNGVNEISTEALDLFNKTKNRKRKSLVFPNEKKFDSFINKMNLTDKTLISFLNKLPVQRYGCTVAGWH